MAKGNTHSSVLQDIDALLHYEPRQRALELLATGKMEAFIDWELGEGEYAAYGKNRPREPRFAEAYRRETSFKQISLDSALNNRVRDAIKDPGHKCKILRLAIEKIPHLFESPIEISLRSARAEQFEKALTSWSAPIRRFHGTNGSSNNGQGWIGFHTRAFILMFEDKLEDSQVIDCHKSHSLLCLALLLGKFEHANAMVRLGLRPDTDYLWETFNNALYKIQKLPLEEQQWITACESPQIEAAIEWAERQSEMFDQMEEACDELEPPQACAKFIELLGQGASFSYYPMVKAIEWNNLELLELMLKNEADPNIKYKTGVPLLARAGDILTPEALTLFLKYGANPTMGELAENYFGDGWNPSLITSLVFSGKLELLKIACGQAVEPIALRREAPPSDPDDDQPNSIDKTKFYESEMLALALNKGHGEMAAWMITEHGCRLEDNDPESGDPCSAFGEGDTIEEAKAAQLQAEMKASLPKAGLRKTSSLENTP